LEYRIRAVKVNLLTSARDSIAALIRGLAEYERLADEVVLDESAIAFYRSLGAEPVDGWTIYRMSGDAISRLAGP
jgi:hypothetical protein